MGIIRDYRGNAEEAPFSQPSGFNLGAFILAYLWGLGNGSFKKTLPILICEIFLAVPIVNIIVFFVWVTLRIIAGLRGNNWAYENRAWYDKNDFVETQKRYAIAGIAVVIAIIISFISGYNKQPAVNYNQFNNASSYSSNLQTGTSTSNTDIASPVNEIIHEIISREQLLGQKFENGDKVADYMLKNSKFVRRNKNILTASKQTSNSIKLTFQKNPTSVPYLFLFVKESNCSITKKNCSVTMYQFGKPTAKSYYDDNGNIKPIKVKVVNKK